MRTESIYIETRGNYVVEIFPDQDQSALDPRKEFENFGHMVCFHRRYSLGDNHDFSVDEFKDFLQQKDVFSLRLYIYDHSGITMSTTPFPCPWDSGCVGAIYVGAAEIKKEFGAKRVTKKIIGKALERLRAEVEIYDDYLTGNVYGYTVSRDGETVSSCWGFYGDYDRPGAALEHAQNACDCLRKQAIKDHLRTLKAQIRAKAPIQYRRHCPVKQ